VREAVEVSQAGLERRVDLDPGLVVLNGDGLQGHADDLGEGRPGEPDRLVDDAVV
jgi:hypothetical protein